ncbi:hypothetical protein [Helicobacter sp. T3_23-1059]
MTDFPPPLRRGIKGVGIVIAKHCHAFFHSLNMTNATFVILSVAKYLYFCFSFEILRAKALSMTNKKTNYDKIIDCHALRCNARNDRGGLSY